MKNRTVQRYQDAATRDIENPTPTLGDLAFVEDILQIQIFTGTDWVEVFSAAASGQLTVSATSNQISIFDTDQGANPRANLDHNSGTLAVRIGDIGDFVNILIFDRDEVRTGDVPLRTIRSGNEDLLMMENTAATHQWRWRVDNAGRLNLSSSPDGVVYTVVEQWLPL